MLSNREAIAIIIRMLEGSLDESPKERSTNYYKRAQELGLLEGLPLNEKSAKITRGTIATLLYRSAQSQNIGIDYTPPEDLEYTTNQETGEDTSGLDVFIGSGGIFDMSQLIKITSYT